MTTAAMFVTWPLRLWVPAAGASSAEIATAGVIVGLLFLRALVKLFDFRGKREIEASMVQAQISDALLLNATPDGVPLTPTARIPFWKGSPVIVEVSGQVPPDKIRRTALRIMRGCRNLPSNVLVLSCLGQDERRWRRGDMADEQSDLLDSDRNARFDFRSEGTLLRPTPAVQRSGMPIAIQYGTATSSTTRPASTVIHTPKRTISGALRCPRS